LPCLEDCVENGKQLLLSVKLKLFVLLKIFFPTASFTIPEQLSALYGENLQKKYPLS
jgi:hypothetical protein